MNALDAALAYAACGLPVFPCLPRAKEPAVARASTPQRRIRKPSGGSGGLPIATSASPPAWPHASGFSTWMARTARQSPRPRSQARRVAGDMGIAHGARPSYLVLL